MRIDALRTVLTYGVVYLTLIGGFYAIVLNEFVIDDLSKGALIGFMGMALNFVLGTAVAKQTSVATTEALMTPSPPAPSNGAIAAAATPCPLDGVTEAHVHGDGTHWP
jgi:hypothetical protein